VEWAGSSRRTRVCLALLVSLIMLGAGGSFADARRHSAFPTLALGNAGIDVAAVQHLLRHAGFGLMADGSFDAATQAAVAETQAVRGLRVDGVVDADTWQALIVPLGPGDAGEAVRAIQRLLNAKRGAGLAETATYDQPTTAAVGAFQRHVGLPRTDAVDESTWRSLLAHFARASRTEGTLCHYHSGNGHAAKWGTASAIGQLEAAAAAFHARTGLRVSVGEISFIGGGAIRHHATHESGLDVDIGLVRRDGRQCRRLGLSYRQPQYDRDATRQLIQAIYDSAPGMVKLIYFNDPVLISEGLAVRYPRHDDHLHVRYCLPRHSDQRYRCAVPDLPSTAERQQVLAAQLGPGTLRPAPLDLRSLRY
jgi:peptidoglycan hydrolase-like protein with peptidoglycan-binding domain